MENGFWYSEATLTLGERLLRAGTLIQCARRWENLSSEDKPNAAIKLAAPLDGLKVLQGEQITDLATRPGYKFA